MDVIRLIQKTYKNSLASSKVLNCLSCGRGDANFEKAPLYVKSLQNEFFVNKLPKAVNKQTKFRKERGQSAFVINHKMKNIGVKHSVENKNIQKKAEVKRKRPQSGIPQFKMNPNKENLVDYGKYIIDRDRLL